MASSTDRRDPKTGTKQTPDAPDGTRTRTHDLNVWREIHSDARAMFDDELNRYRVLSERAIKLIEFDGALLAILVVLPQLQGASSLNLWAKISSGFFILSVAFVAWAYKISNVAQAPMFKDFNLVYRDRPSGAGVRRSPPSRHVPDVRESAVP